MIPLFARAAGLAVVCALASCTNGPSALFSHGVAIPPAQREIDRAVFANGFTGNRFDSLVIVSEPSLTDQVNGTGTVTSGDVSIPFVVPDDLRDWSGWLREDFGAAREAHRIDLDYRRLHRSGSREVVVRFDGIPKGVQWYLWRLPKWYLVR